jgi:copper(I)-binding protein
MKKSVINSLLFGIASSAAVSLVSAEGLYAEDAYIRAMPPGQQITAAFLNLVNNSDKACKVVGGSSAIAADLQIHEHQHSDGMMKMRPLQSVTVEAGQRLVFEPGQLHLMLFGIQTPLVPGQQQEFTLTTENCGSIVVAAEVRSLFKKSALKESALKDSSLKNSMEDSKQDHSGHNHHHH